MNTKKRELERMRRVIAGDYPETKQQAWNKLRLDSWWGSLDGSKVDAEVTLQLFGEMK